MYGLRPLLLNLQRELKEDSKIVPVPAPRLYGIRILATPFALKIVESGCCHLLVGGIVDVLHVGSKLLLVLVDHILAGVAYLVYDAYLRGGIGKNGAYRLCESVEVVGAGYEYILHTTGLNVCEYAHPEERTLALAYPQPSTSLRPFCLSPTHR